VARTGIKSLVQFGLDATLLGGGGALGDIAGDALQSVFGKVRNHFTLSSQDLALAFQTGFGQAADAIALGVAPAGWIDAVRSKPGRLVAAKITKEFAERIETRYVQPFAGSRRLEGKDIARFRKQVVGHCRSLSELCNKILPAQDFPDGVEAADLLRQSRQNSVTRLILDQIGQHEFVLPADVADFLRHEDLIGQATLFFIQEALRRDARVRETLNALRQEAIWTEIETNRADLGQVRQLFGALSEALADQPKLLADTIDALQASLVEEIQSVGADVGVVQEQTAEILAVVGSLKDMLSGYGRDADIKVADAVVPISGGNAGLIDQARALLKLDQGGAGRIPGAANTIAAALISTGDERRTGEAERLLEDAYQAATDPAEKARAAHNLFQVRLLRQDYEAALGPLTAALRLDLRRYSPTELIGTEPKYHVQRILGAGGMGCVYLCNETVRRRLVAVKTLWQSLKSGPASTDFGEFQAMAELGGGIVPRAFDYGISPGTGQPYIVMEYLDGYLDGEAWLDEQGALSAAEATDLGLQVARALQTAHERMVQGRPVPLPHLDLKPANLMLKRTDQGLSVKMIDWGLARFAVNLADATRAGSRAGNTQFGQMVMGTWDYAPPEQMGRGGTAPPGPKSDIYALGKTLYRLVTGANAHTVSPRKLSDLGALGKLIQDCVEADPGDRPDAADLVRALADLSGPGTPTAPPGEPEPTSAQPKPAPRPRAEPKAPSPRPAPSPKPAVEVLAGRWPEKGCVFRDFGQGGKADKTLPEMVIIPAGSFLMGSPEDEPEREAHEGPQHEVTLARPFAMGRYAVTQAEWQALMGNNPSRFKGDRNPVEEVSWNDVQEFIAALNKKLGLADGGGYRLPSEAEWEYACRAGTTTPFWWGSTITTDQANYDGRMDNIGGLLAKIGLRKGTYRQKTVPVDEFAPNPFGLYQMHGNVWEWCQDCWNKNYNGAPTDGSAWTQGDCEIRVLRGGGWVTYPWYVRSASRSWGHPGYRYDGFRLARTLTLES